jgi:hypothetical protein
MKILKKIEKDVIKRLYLDMGEQQDVDIYRVTVNFNSGESLDLIDQTIEFIHPTVVIFIDKKPVYNWGHPCMYYLYDSDNGFFLEMIEASFPPFFPNWPSNAEPIKLSEKTRGFFKK